MNRKHKLYFKLNLFSLFFIAVSFISMTLAWFAYSGLSTVETEIDVKAWYIEFTKDAKAVSNDIIISLSEIYPGMDTITQSVTINNLGDSLAQLDYEITSARILDTEYSTDNNIDSEYIEDQLSHAYPFNINIALEKNYVREGGDTSMFNVSISWPLDSDNDEADSYWGTEAYKFQTNENDKYDKDNSYQPRTSIKIVISVNATQHLNTLDAVDSKYKMGNLVLYDVANNRSCNTLGGSCIKTHVITKKSLIGDEKIELLPDLYGTYLTSNYENYNTTLQNLVSTWNVNTRALNVDDLLNIISNDVFNSYLVRDNLSNSIIGNLNYDGRMTTELNKAIKYNGYYSYDATLFDYLISSKCYWTSSNYNETNAFAFTKVDNKIGKIYPNEKTNECSIVPVIIAPKSNIN